MKSSFSAFVCSLGLAAASTSGPRLVKDHILAVATDTSSFIEYINSLHLGQDGSENTQTADTLMNVFVNCIEQVVELEKCYGDQALVMECVDCAWAGVLSETSIICDGIEAALEADTTRCDSCLSKCDEEQASLVTCAVRLYCPESSEEEEHSKVSLWQCLITHNTCRIRIRFSPFTASIVHLYISPLNLSFIQ